MKANLLRTTLRRVPATLGLALVLACLLPSWLPAQVPNLLHYQGHVVTNGVNFDGDGRFKFALVNGDGTVTYWSNDGTSTAGGEPTAAVTLQVEQGLYDVLLGDTSLPNMTAVAATVFANSDVRLRVWFSPAAEGTLEQLSPDQRIAAVGYALMAATVPDGAITAAKLATHAVTGATLAPGSVTPTALADGAVDGAKIQDGTVTAADLHSTTLGTFWKTGGNDATTPGSDFLGTTDNQPLEFKVNNQRALRLEPNLNEGAPNVIGGSPWNVVDAGVIGATIAGGGATNWGGRGYTNRISSSFSSIGGGMENTCSGPYATIAGGAENLNSGSHAAIGGGQGNDNSGPHAAIGGGWRNTNSGIYGTVGGGEGNANSGLSATISGGQGNANSGWYAAIGGGLNNQALADSATVPGGEHNTAARAMSFAAGRRAKANHTGSFVWADSTDADFASTGTNQFCVRASGGARIVGTTNVASMLTLTSDSTFVTGLDFFNTTTPHGLGGYRLQVVGSNEATRAGNFEIWKIGAGANLLTLQTNGDVGIGTTSPSYKLHVNGSVAGVGPYHDASDARFKTNITGLAGALATIQRLRGVQFDWRQEEFPDLQFEKSRQVGFIAQEVKEVLPEAVSEDHQGHYSVAYSRVVPVLVEALKEQQAAVAAKEARLGELEKKIARMETLLDALLQK